MAPRKRHLEAIDDGSAPLPHGTEIVTRVERDHGGRRVPLGSIGRVARVDGDRLDVSIVGFGTVGYARDEVSARRHGQLLYAQRRAANWEELHGCIVLEATVGSRAWGLADERSDEDHRGVFAVPFSWTQGLAAPPEDLVSLDGSSTYWATGKTVQQALRADPNTLEMLFVPGTRVADPIGQWLLDERDAFVSVEIYGSFGRYALGQLRKLEQARRLAEHRELVLDWLREEPDLDLDTLARKLALATATDEHQGRQYVKQLNRSLADQGLLTGNDLSALAEFARVHAHHFELPRELRPKNAYNLLRLLATATHWLREGEPCFTMQGAFRERLLAIKRGAVPLADVLAEAESLAPALERARHDSRLPARVDLPRADRLQRRIGEELARRWFERAAGPFGANAPPAPEVTWMDRA